MQGFVRRGYFQLFGFGYDVSVLAKRGDYTGKRKVKVVIRERFHVVGYRRFVIHIRAHRRHEDVLSYFQFRNDLRTVLRNAFDTYPNVTHRMLRVVALLPDNFLYFLLTERIAYVLVLLVFLEVVIVVLQSLVRFVIETYVVGRKRDYLGTLRTREPNHEVERASALLSVIALEFVVGDDLVVFKGKRQPGVVRQHIRRIQTRTFAERRR